MGSIEGRLIMYGKTKTARVMCIAGNSKRREFGGLITNLSSRN